MLVGAYYKNKELDFKTGNVIIQKGDVLCIHSSYGGNDIEVMLFDTQQHSKLVSVNEEDIDKAIKLGILVKVDKESIIKEEHKESEYQIGDFVTDGNYQGIVNHKTYDLEDGWYYELWQLNSSGDSFRSSINYNQDELEKIDELNYEIEIKKNKFNLKINKIEDIEKFNIGEHVQIIKNLSKETEGVKTFNELIGKVFIVEEVDEDDRIVTINNGEAWSFDEVKKVNLEKN